jgi:ubiquinone/menaquinone biosynthesis C-methylase UbiE
MGISGWYDKLFAAVYDPLLDRTESRTLSPLRLELLGEVKGLVLDLGAGTGSNLPFLKTTAGPRIFLDRSLPMLRKGLEKGMGKAGFPVVGSATALPFPPETFDSIVVTLVLCSVDNLLKSLEELHRVLKPEGRLYAMEHVLSDSRVVAAFQHAATPPWKILAGGCHLDRPTDTLLRSLFLEKMHRTETLSGIPFHLGIYTKKPYPSI